MTPERELKAAVGLCLAGSSIALLAGSRSWGAATIKQVGLAVRTAPVSGDVLAPGLRALALVGLAGVVALLATSRWGRIAVGAVIFGAGLGIVFLALDRGSGAAVIDHLPQGVSVSMVSKLTSTAWPLAAWFGGLLLTGSGLLVLWRGRRWAALSGAYRTPAARAEDAGAQGVGPVTDKGVWDALDRGEDPTG